MSKLKQKQRLRKRVEEVFQSVEAIVKLNYKDFSFDKVSVQIMDKDQTKKVTGSAGYIGVCLTAPDLSEIKIIFNIDEIKKDSSREIKNTILHELAHAITSLHHKTTGHCKEWISVCKKINCDYSDMGWSL